jgi:hypothetical protein
MAGQAKTSNNVEMVLLEAAFVVGIVGVVIYTTIWLLMRSRDQRHPVTTAGQWRTAHYDIKGQTRVVLRKISLGGGSVLDEHVIATIRVDDPDYDSKFLTAMSTARERRALFEAEQED